MKRRNQFQFRYVYLALFFVVLYLPILSVVLYSFNDGQSIASWQGFSLRWYESLWQDRVIKESLWLSLQVGLFTALLSSIMGTYAALVSMKSKAKMKKTLSGAMMLPLLVPEVALGISLLVLYNFLKIPLGRLTLVLSHTLFCMPYVYVMVQIRLDEIDPSMIEASRDLGASSWQTIKLIILPLVKPAIFSASLLSLAMSLDDVVISTYVSGSQSTLPVHIFSMMRVGVTPKINALCTVILLITFLILGFSQKKPRYKGAMNT